MSTNEVGQNVERNAKELLSSLQAECPEKVWQELSYELEEGAGSNEGVRRINRKALWAIILAILLGTPAVYIVMEYFSGSKGTTTPAVNVTTPLVQHPAAKVAQEQPKPIQANAAAPTRHDTEVLKSTVPVVMKKMDTIHHDSLKISMLQSTPPLRKPIHHKDSIARDTQFKHKLEIRKAREEYALKRRNKSHSAANDSLNSHFYHMVNKEPFPADSSGH